MASSSGQIESPALRVTDADRSTDRLLAAVDALAPSLSELFDRVAAATRDGAGVSRDAYGEQETLAGRILMDYARSLGLDADFDRVGNLNVTRGGHFQRAPELLIGSHIDSVPVGGNYDGLAGVVAGIAVLVAMQRENTLPDSPVRVIGFRGEESPWFGTAYIGSKLFLGQLSDDDVTRLRRFDTGRSLADHMRSLGLDPDGLAKEPICPMERVKAYLELHIEQGPLLESLQRPVGVATAIRGNIRFPFAKCIGRYAHSAAVPRQFRSDALLSTAKLVAFADDCWRALIDEGYEDLVFTCGILHTNPAEHAMTKVPGEVSFSLNMGATSDAAMKKMHDSIVARAEELVREHNVRFDFGPRVGTPAVSLDDSLTETVVRAGEDIGLPPHRMPTVGHDAAMFARIGVPTSIVLVRNANGSHNPCEHMEMTDFVLGVKVLASSVQQLF